MNPDARKVGSPSHPAPKSGGLIVKAEEWAHEWSPPPEAIRFRWLYQIERLAIGWNTECALAPHEVRFRRNITHWIMSERGARQSLPHGYRVQAWDAPEQPRDDRVGEDEMRDTEWAPARTKKLRALRSEGLGLAEIARRMGISKNAVVGKAHRIKLPGLVKSQNNRGGAGEVMVARQRSVVKRAVRESTGPLPKLAELVNTDPTPPVASGPPATPKLHPPTHKSAAGLEAARQKAAEATRVEVPKEAESAVTTAPCPPVEREGCRFPIWAHNARVPSPPLFCGGPPILTRDAHGNPVRSSYCERCHFITHSDSEAAKASLRLMYAERL